MIQLIQWLRFRLGRRNITLWHKYLNLICTLKHLHCFDGFQLDNNLGKWFFNVSRHSNQRKWSAVFAILSCKTAISEMVLHLSIWGLLFSLPEGGSIIIAIVIQPLWRKRKNQTVITPLGKWLLLLTGFIYIKELLYIFGLYPSMKQEDWCQHHLQLSNRYSSSKQCAFKVITDNIRKVRKWVQ